MKVEFISVDHIEAKQHESAPKPRPTKSSKTAVSTTNSLDPQSQTKDIQPRSTVGSKQKLHSKSKQRFTCPICKMSFSTKKSYNLHKKNHSNDVKYDRDEVDKLSTHIRKHEGKVHESQKYQCNICQVCFNDLNDLDAHVFFHFDLEIRYKCSICDNSFFDIDHQVKHTGVVHGDALNVTFHCYVCGSLLNSIDEFVNHDHQHKKESGTLKCSECGDTFPTIAALNSHKKNHTIPRTQRYACQKCNLRFSRSEDLHNHIRVHDGKSIYCCAICDRMFAHSKNLTNHVHKNHKSCFTADEMHLIDFVVKAEVDSQMDRNKLGRILQDENSPVDGDVFSLDVRQLVTKYMKKEVPSLPPLSIASPLIPKNITRRYTELFRKYQCPLCELIFVKAKTLEIHCKRNHFGCYTLDELKNIQKAADRNTSQSFPRGILNSRLTITKKHECPACSLMYESRQELIRHLKIDHNGDLPFKCLECSNVFQTSNHLADHVFNHPDKRHECKFCGLTFMNFYSLGKHTKRHEGPNIESCSICNIPYREKKDLVKHMRIHADGKPHKCLYCDKRFAQSCDRQKHMRIHTGERPYVCKICGKSFAHLTSIKKHNYVHTGERFFQCTTCGKSFQHSSNLVVHNRTHTGERPYKCKVCEKSFYASGHYVDHMKIHIGIKNYECQVCHKSFIHLSSFQKHKRVHSGEKPYVCQLCNRGFSQSGHFREHMMIHSGEKPHKCDICEKSFRRSDALQCHKKTHKKDTSKNETTEAIANSDEIVPINEMSYDDNILQYNDDNENQLQNLHDQSELMNEVDQSDMGNIQSITVVRQHQTDMGEQNFNTFSYNFIL